MTTQSGVKTSKGLSRIDPTKTFYLSKKSRGIFSRAIKKLDLRPVDFAPQTGTTAKLIGQLASCSRRRVPQEALMRVMWVLGLSREKAGLAQA